MGNRVSIAQEERDEAEFQHLVNEVVRVRGDLESGYSRNGRDGTSYIEYANPRYYPPSNPRTPYFPFDEPWYPQRPQPPVHIGPLAPAPFIPDAVPSTVPVTIFAPPSQQTPIVLTQPHSLSTISERTPRRSRTKSPHVVVIQPPRPATISSPPASELSSASLVASESSSCSNGKVEDREENTDGRPPPREPSHVYVGQSRLCPSTCLDCYSPVIPPVTVIVASSSGQVDEGRSTGSASPARTTVQTAPHVISGTVPVRHNGSRQSWSRRSRSPQRVASRSRSRSRSRWRSLSPIILHASTPSAPAPVTGLPRARSGSLRSRSPMNEQRHSPTTPGTTQTPVAIQPQPIIMRTSSWRSHSPVMIVRPRRSSSHSRSNSPDRYPAERSRRAAQPRSRSRSPRIIFPPSMLSRRERISRSPVRRRTSRSPSRRCFSRSPIRRNRYSPPRSPSYRPRTYSSRSASIVRPPPQGIPNSTADDDRFYRVVEGFERAVQELIRSQQEQQEQHRQYEDRLLAALKWRDAGAAYSRPHTPFVGIREHAEEGLVETKEVHLQDRGGFDIRAYPNVPFAAGLAIGIKNIPSWEPVWQVFPLKAFRGSNYTFLKIHSNWDDAELLRELSRTYDRLRTWRKWFSLRSVSGITMVLADHSFVYPQRVGPARVSPAKNMRLRYLLQHPHTMRHRYEFMQVMTSRTDLGIEFVERFQLKRIAFAVFLPVVLATLFGVLWAVLTRDVSGAFTISGYMTSAYSVCLVLVGVINLVEY